MIRALRSAAMHIVSLLAVASVGCMPETARAPAAEAPAVQADRPSDDASGGPASHEADPAGHDQPIPTAESVVDAELLCERGSVRPGETVTLGLRFAIDPGWHMYGDAASDSGNPPDLAWTLPEGGRLGDVSYPVAERYLMPGPMVDHIYVGDVTLLVRFTAPGNARPGDELTLTVDVEFLVCEEFCLLGEKTLRLTLPVVSRLEPISLGAGSQAVLDARLRMAGAPRGDVAVTWEGRAATVRVPGAAALAFHPDRGGLAIDDLAEHGAAQGDTLHLPIAGYGHGGDELRGVLIITPTGGGKPTSHLFQAPSPASLRR